VFVQLSRLARFLRFLWMHLHLAQSYLMPQSWKQVLTLRHPCPLCHEDVCCDYEQLVAVDSDFERVFQPLYAW
jgi:hypothetical protein